MVNGLFLYRAHLDGHSKRFYTTSHINSHSMSESVQLYRLHGALFSVTQTAVDAPAGNMGSSVLPEDTSARGPGNPGAEPPTFQLADD